jgi:histidinol-phosphatase (PHP family)
MYLADCHVHSTCSPDGKYTMAEMARAALDAGLSEICFTDHMDTIRWRSYEPCWDFDWDRSLAQYREAQALYGDRLAIRLGAELGEAALSFERAEHLLDHTPPLDFVIGSVHMTGAAFGHMDLYDTPEGDEAYYHAVIASYLDDVAALARWGRFHVLGHLTLPLRYINERYRAGVSFAPHMDRVREIFRALIARGVGIECNTNRGHEPLPGADLLRIYREMGGEIITLGTDAHTTEYVGCAIRERQELLRQCGFRYFTTFTQGKPEFRPL